MVKSIYKLFFDFAKEERWLAQMSENGRAFVSVNCFGKYTFQQIEPNLYNYRIDYRIFKSVHDFQEYCSIFEDSGWKHLWGTRNSGSQYFVQCREDASDDIFSDSSSRAGRYKRLSTMWLSLFTAFLPVAIALFMTNQYRLTAFTAPKTLYFTPGLWDMHGVQFWRAFLFETPFVLGRGFLWLLFLVILAFYFFAYFKAWLLYRRYLKDI